MNILAIQAKIQDFLHRNTHFDSIAETENRNCLYRYIQKIITTKVGSELMINILQQFESKPISNVVAGTIYEVGPLKFKLTPALIIPINERIDIRNKIVRNEKKLLFEFGEEPSYFYKDNKITLRTFPRNDISIFDHECKLQAEEASPEDVGAYFTNYCTFIIFYVTQ